MSDMHALLRRAGLSAAGELDYGENLWNAHTVTRADRVSVREMINDTKTGSFSYTDENDTDTRVGPDEGSTDTGLGAEIDSDTDPGDGYDTASSDESGNDPGNGLDMVSGLEAPGTDSSEASDTLEPDDNPFRYCGEYFDSEGEGQYYLRARYYSPRLGRFTTEDPARADGFNWYVYCMNNPIIYKDVTGKDAILISKLVDNKGSKAGIEHTGVFFQDINDDWYFFSWQDEVKYGKVDDTSIFDNMDDMNKWLSKNKLKASNQKYGNRNIFQEWFFDSPEHDYTDSVYIKGNFITSQAEASDLFGKYNDSLKTWDKKGFPNKGYSISPNNCGQKAMELLSMGTLPGEMNVGSYIELNGIPTSVIPNVNMNNMQGIFYNRATTLSGFNSAMQTQREKYEGKSRFAQWWHTGLRNTIDMISSPPGTR